MPIWICIILTLRLKTKRNLISIIIYLLNVISRWKCKQTRQSLFLLLVSLGENWRTKTNVNSEMLQPTISEWLIYDTAVLPIEYINRLSALKKTFDVCYLVFKYVLYIIIHIEFAHVIVYSHNWIRRHI